MPFQLLRWGPRRDERGQTVPVLLFAIFAGLAATAVWVTLGRGFDQSDRAVTASDAAALAAARQERDDFVNQFGSASRLKTLHQYLLTFGTGPNVARAATQYAVANGADLQGVTSSRFDSGSSSWTFEAQTKQRDAVTDDDDLRARNKSKAKATVTGLCDGGNGIQYDGRCLTASTYEDECVIEPPPPPPPPSPGSSPSATATPEPEPEPEPAAWCDDNLAYSLSWTIALTD